MPVQNDHYSKERLSRRRLSRGSAHAQKTYHGQGKAKAVTLRPVPWCTESKAQNKRRHLDQVNQMEKKR